MKILGDNFGRKVGRGMTPVVPPVPTPTRIYVGTCTIYGLTHERIISAVYFFASLKLLPVCLFILIFSLKQMFTIFAHRLPFLLFGSLKF